jgi:hypothetical protein
MENKVLLFGPDSVWVNVSYGDRPVRPGEEHLVQSEPRPLEEMFSEILVACQEAAREQEKPFETPFEFADAPLMMYPNSGGLTSSWRFILRNYAMELKVGMGKRNGIIAKVRLSAEYLWLRRNLDAILRDLHTWLASREFFGAPVYLSASELHICTDTVGYDFSHSDWQEGFIRRSAFTPHFEDYSFVEEATSEEEEGETTPFLPGPDKLHMRYRAITGFTFGSHKSAVSAVIYNKSNYIKYKAKTTTWFHPMWKANGWDGETDVWRTEIRFKRPALAESRSGDAALDSAYDLVTFLPGLWQYATQSWLRYVVPGSDVNRARWQSHDAWVVVQMAYQQALTSDQLDMRPIIREHKRVANMDQMVAQIVGCFITLHAWRLLNKMCSEDTDMSEVLHDFYPNAQDYIDNKERKARNQGKQWDFVKEVRYKQVLYSQAETA